MKPDCDIKRDVQAELRWSPEVDDSQIAVDVTDGLVRLSGVAGNYFEKHQVAVAAKRVAGVTEVTDNIEVRLPPCEGLTDHQIERDAVAALKAHLPMCWQAITPRVHVGKVVLEGEVEWNYQRERAQLAACRLRGVVSVENWVRLRPHAHTNAYELKRKIQQALERSADVDASLISIEASGSEVTLKGEVRSWAERDRAQTTAWAAPGVGNVWNELTVRASP